MTAKQIAYSKGWAETIRDLNVTMDKWGLRRNAFEIDAPASKWGSYSQQLAREQRVVTVGFRTREGKEIELTCDAQATAAGNLRVLYLAIEGLRMNEVRGLADVMRAAYLQLEAPERVRDPYEVLGVRPDADIDIIEAAYKARARQTHPDAGGSADAFDEVRKAYEAVKEAG